MLKLIFSHKILRDILLELYVNITLILFVNSHVHFSCLELQKC